MARYRISFSFIIRQEECDCGKVADLLQSIVYFSVMNFSLRLYFWLHSFTLPHFLEMFQAYFE
jgi:hypothetical protein